MATRRDFIHRSTAATVGLGLASWSGFPGRARAVAANDQIHIGLIGCKGMGFSDLRSMLRVPEATCIALCDVDENVAVLEQQTLSVSEDDRPACEPSVPTATIARCSKTPISTRS